MHIITQPESFEGSPIDVIIMGGEKWVGGPQIGAALGFADPAKAMRKIYSRSIREFDDTTNIMIEMPTAGGRQLVRLYNARGAALIAMKAQTPKGEAFRRWVLDVLEGKADIEGPAAAPASGLSGTALAYLRSLFLGGKGNSQLVRLRAAGLRPFEIAKVQDVSVNFIGKKLRVAEELGLLEASAGTLQRRASSAFTRLQAQRRASYTKNNASRAAQALPAPAGEKGGEA